MCVYVWKCMGLEGCHCGVCVCSDCNSTYECMWVYCKYDVCGITVWSNCLTECVFVVETDCSCYLLGIILIKANAFERRCRRPGYTAISPTSRSSLLHDSPLNDFFWANFTEFSFEQHNYINSHIHRAICQALPTRKSFCVVKSPIRVMFINKTLKLLEYILSESCRVCVWLPVGFIITYHTLKKTWFYRIVQIFLRKM